MSCQGALVSVTSIDVFSTGSIDVGSHRLPTESIGAGERTGAAPAAGVDLVAVGDPADLAGRDRA